MPKLRSVRYRLRDREFRFKSGSNPVFINSDVLAYIGPRGVEIWSRASRSRQLQVKSVSNAGSFAYSWENGWMATMNSSGQLGYASLSTGELLKKTKRRPYQDGYNIAAWTDGLHLIDASWDGDIYIHDTRTRAVISHESIGDDWMSAGVDVSPSTGSVWIAFNPKYAHPRSGTGSLWKFSWPVALKTGTEIELPHAVKSFAVAPDGKRIAVVLDRRCGEEDDQGVLLILGSDGNVLSQTDLPRCPSLEPPAWSPTGNELALILDQNRLVFLDVDTLGVVEQVSGPHLSGVAYSPDGNMVAIATGEGGIVLLRSQVAEWSETEGRPQADLAEAQIQAYCRRIELRKASPPRVAVFRTANTYVVEAERLVGDYRYLPLSAPEVLSIDCPMQDLGAAVKRALARFEASESAREPLFAPGFPGEAERLALHGVKTVQMGEIRYLGYPNPYTTTVIDPLAYVSICSCGGVLDFWPCPRYDSGEFGEADWPRKILADDSALDQIGKTLVEALGTALKTIKGGKCASG
jgi:DNA-binding beta-propeller fold protein YncE